MMKRIDAIESLRHAVNQHNDRINCTKYDVCRPHGRIYVIDIGCPECAEDSKIAPMNKPARERQVGGDHYKKLAIQPTEYAYKNGLGPHEFLALRYITRHRDKGGREDLEKAIHTLEMLMEEEYPDK